PPRSAAAARARNNRPPPRRAAPTRRRNPGTPLVTRRAYSKQIASLIERHRGGLPNHAQLRILPDFSEQRFGDPHLVECRGIPDAAQPRRVPGQRRIERDLYGLAVGREGERQAPFARVAARFGG